MQSNAPLPDMQVGAPGPAPDVAEFHAALSGMGSDPQDDDDAKPEPTPERLALVKKMQASIQLDYAHWKKVAFDRMKTSRQMTRDGADKAWRDSGLYVTNILQHHVRQKVAGLYAKNPRVTVNRRQTMDFAMWDGSAETLQAAAMAPADNAALLQDVQQGAVRRKMRDGVAHTLQLVAQHQLDEQSPPLKITAKAMLTRAVICGVGYVKLGYTRHMAPAPEVLTETSNIEARMAFLERLIADNQDDDTQDEEGQCEQLRLALAEMREAPLQISDEGIRLDWPKSDAIIPDRNLRDLHGFQGCNYVTEQMMLTEDEIEEMFDLDIDQAGSGVNYYSSADALPIVAQSSIIKTENNTNKIKVWCCYHRRDGLVYWMAEGYRDFLTEPHPPQVMLKRFWPWFALTLNISEDEDNPFPPSDIELITTQQMEINRSRQGIRDHRIAARPKWAVPDGKLDPDDLDRLSSGEAHDIVIVKGLANGEKIGDIMQRIKHEGIDPALYDTSLAYQDILRAVGTSQADMGAPSGVTATEASIGENAHISSASSNADDLDTLLSEVMQEAGRVLLLEMDAKTVTNIAGPGAVWPQIAPEDVLSDIALDIEAGSSGKPNRAAALQAFERLAPLMLQMPGVKPAFMIKEAVNRLDDRLDPTDAILDGVPSIMAMAHIHQMQAQNGMAPQGATGQQGPAPAGAPPSPNPGNPQPSAMPHAQAPSGGMNTPQPPGSQFTPPARPAPGTGAEVMGGRMPG